MAQQFDVTVVVSGQPVQIRVNLNQEVQHLVHEALENSGNKGQAPSAWDLRTATGELIGQSQTIAHAGIVAGVTLFLSPQAGIGGGRR